MDVGQQVEQINAFLTAVYRRPQRLSDILIRHGADAAVLAAVRQQGIVVVVEQVCARWQTWLATVLEPRKALILVRRYGLDGAPPASFVALGAVLGVSGERVRQLEQRARGRLRPYPQKRALEAIVVEVVQALVPWGQATDPEGGEADG